MFQLDILRETVAKGQDTADNSVLRKKILYFVTEDWFVCSHWLPHIAAARDAGYEIHVAARVQNHRAAIEALGVRLIPLRLSRRGSNPFAELKFLVGLIRLYRRLRPDLAHHVAMKPVLYGSVAALFSGTRATVNYMSGLGWLFTSDSAGVRLLRPLVRMVLGRLLATGRVIVENPDDHAQMLALGLNPERIHLIRGAGVDLAKFRRVGENAGPPLVVLASRMLWTKGAGEFVAAAERLRGEGVAARFALVGDPDPENPASIPLERLESWKREGAVEWWGRRDDMAEVFAESSIVCLPSYREGLPKVLIEAAAAGRPIVTTFTPGCREVVRDGDNGFLVPPRDAESLADALRRLLRDPPLRERMGRRGREIAEAEFGVGRVTGQVLEIYGALLE
jgi:glycosyltransferase involved in cell wall biosynthesis